MYSFLDRRCNKAGELTPTKLENLCSPLFSFLLAMAVSVRVATLQPLTTAPHTTITLLRRRILLSGRQVNAVYDISKSSSKTRVRSATALRVIVFLSYSGTSFVVQKSFTYLLKVHPTMTSSMLLPVCMYSSTKSTNTTKIQSNHRVTLL